MRPTPPARGFLPRGKKDLGEKEDKRTPGKESFRLSATAYFWLCQEYRGFSLSCRLSVPGEGLITHDLASFTLCHLLLLE
ncbi:hypothetical protein CEB3_c39440 [Peptococcaceae bacterium CEB3]|nr:hypothetical protein CEB3_c39440 [Peptococcaceae bacterium CEB3]